MEKNKHNAMRKQIALKKQFSHLKKNVVYGIISSSWSYVFRVYCFQSPHIIMLLKKIATRKLKAKGPVSQFPIPDSRCGIRLTKIT
jgi:hypothetical protein